MAIPRTPQRQPAPPGQEIAERCRSQDAAIAAAHATGVCGDQQIAEVFGVGFSTGGPIVLEARKAGMLRSQPCLLVS